MIWLKRQDIIVWVTCIFFITEKIHQSSKCVETALQNWNEEASLLSAEQYVIKRTIYKLANQFRSEKSLRGLRQVGSFLKVEQATQPASLMFNIAIVLKYCLYSLSFTCFLYFSGSWLLKQTWYAWCLQTAYWLTTLPQDVRCKV